MVDLSVRSEQLELMDDPTIEQGELVRTLDELETINRLLNGYAPSLSGIARLLPRQGGRFSLLDVGTGGGDGARRIAAWAKRRGVELDITAIDLSPTTIDYARARSAGDSSIRFDTADLFALAETERFDVVHCALFLHHMRGDDTVRAIRKMLALARYGVVVNDLHRHRLAFASIGMLTRLFSSSRLIRNDAPLSVARAFTGADLDAIAFAGGFASSERRWHWAFRWSVLFRPETPTGHEA